MRNEFSSHLDAKVPEVYPKAEVAEGKRVFCRQTLVQRDHWLHLVKDSSVLGLKIFLAYLGKNATEHYQLHSLCFVVIDSEIILRELLGPAKSAWKRVLYIKLTEDRCFGKRSSEPMIFVTFSDL